MRRYTHHRPGRRIFKTGLSVFISVQLFYLLGHYNPVQAALACILTLQRTPGESKEKGKNRIIGTLIGGISAYLCLVVLDIIAWETVTTFAPIIVAIFVMLSLSVSKAMNLAPYALAIAATVTTVTLLSHNTSHLDALSYVSLRMLETFVGFGVAYLVNKHVLPMEEKQKD